MSRSDTVEASFELAGPVLVRSSLRGAAAAVGAVTGLERPSLLRRANELLSDPVLVEAVTLASPSTMRACDRLAELSDKELRKLATTLSGYATRLRERATPFGVFAGVCLAGVGTRTAARIDEPERHRRLVGPDAGWLAAIVTSIETSSDGLRALQFSANPSVRLLNGYAVLERPTVGVGLARFRLDAGLLDVLRDASSAPRPGAELIDRLGAGRADGAGERALRSLVSRRFLRSSLEPDPHDPAPFDHVRTTLRRHGLAADLVGHLDTASAAFARYADAPIGAAQDELAAARAAADSATISAGLDPASSVVQVDTVLSAQIELSRDVLAAAADVGAVLARLSGDRERAALQSQLLEKGGGQAIPLAELDPPAAPDAPRPAPDALVAAHAALLRDGRSELELTDALLDELAPGPAPALHQLDLFALLVRNGEGGVDLHLRRPASSSAGVTLARFVDGLGDAGRTAAAHIAAQVQMIDPGAVAADTVFAPRLPGAGNVTRTAASRPVRVGVDVAGGPEALTPDDLSLAPGPAGPEVWSSSLRRRVVPQATSALNPAGAGPAAAQVLAAASAQHIAVRFDWGTLAASPWLPRVRRGQVVLAPQTWRLGGGLSGDGADDADWADRLTTWRTQWSVPRTVVLAEGDRQTSLDLLDAIDAEVLRRAARRGPVTLFEPLPASARWSADGHVLEAVFPVVAAARPGTDATRLEPEVRPRHRPARWDTGWTRAVMPCPPGARRAVLADAAERHCVVTFPTPDRAEVLTRRDLPGHPLQLLPYPGDAGFGHPVPDVASAEAWALSDTQLAARCRDEDDAVCAVVALSRQLEQQCGRSPLSDLAPDRPGFAPRRRVVLQRLAQHPLDDDTAAAAYVAGAAHAGAAMTRARLLVTERARRLAGPDEAGGLLRLAAAAQFALDSRARAHGRDAA